MSDDDRRWSDIEKTKWGFQQTREYQIGGFFYRDVVLTVFASSAVISAAAAWEVSVNGKMIARGVSDSWAQARAKAKATAAAPPILAAPGEDS